MNETDCIFEQPMNEIIRILLRIEYLAKQINFYMEETHPWHSKTCLMTMLDLLHLFDRHDLRGKLTQELSRHHHNLEGLLNTPGIDRERLENLLRKIDKHLKNLHQNNGKFAQPLRRNDFIASILSNYNLPGGTSNTNAPGLHLWLQQDFSNRLQNLKKWHQEFSDVISITELILYSIRETSTFLTREAQQGFLQISLDPQAPCQLIRVSVPQSLYVFPQISAGRHGVSIRFLDASLDNPAIKTKKNICFKLACCIF